MSKRKRARDECSICKANGSNAVGHLAQWCSYKDGPFEGNFKGAIKAKREAEKEAKKVKGLGGAANHSEQTSSHVLVNEMQIQINKNGGAIDATRQLIDHKHAAISNTLAAAMKMVNEQNQVMKQMQMQLTKLQAEITELKKPTQPQKPQSYTAQSNYHQGQWKNNWRSSSYQNWY